MQARKTMAMVSGHVHSYERFTRAEKTFLVTGGGGARSKVYTDWRRRHLDDCFDGPPLRGFTFSSSRRCRRGLRSRCEDSNSAMGFETLDYLAIPWVSPM